MSIMETLRCQPRVISTLERRIDQNRKELSRVREDLLYETESTGILRRRERTLVQRIERNEEDMNRLLVENMKLRQKMAEALA